MTLGADVLLAVAAAVLLFAAVHDVALRTIPDWVSGVLVLDGVLVRLLDRDLLLGLCCGLAVFAAATFCWWRGWLGGGDVKLLGATAVLVPPALVPGYIVAVAFAGGALALLYLLLQQVVPAWRPRRHGSMVWRILTIECRRIRRRMSIPYATAISAAALLMMA
jgi:prepilin peptidase CpaA